MNLLNLFKYKTSYNIIVKCGSIINFNAHCEIVPSLVVGSLLNGQPIYLLNIIFLPLVDFD